jgi:LAS superfamily LD-carboxypeptidase LdcB
LAISAGFFLTSLSVYSYNIAKDYHATKNIGSLSAVNSKQNSVEQNTSIDTSKSEQSILKNTNQGNSKNTQLNSDKLLTASSMALEFSSKSQNKEPNKEIEIKIIENKSINEIEQDKSATPREVIVEKKLETPAPKSSIVSNPEIAKYKVFEGSQWKEVYEKAKSNYENITYNYDGLNYFGNDNVNQVAIDLAIKRGFIKRGLVSDQSKLVYIEGYPVQPNMANSIKELFKEMRDNGLSITFLSGFRGIPEQSTVFGDEFYKQSFYSLGREISNQEILDRKADGVFNKSYDTVALPGYSRHHYGYTIDVTQPGTFYKDFESTKAYEWMSKDNFYNVKKYGIIPSYPKGVEYQGPEPESWEFIYVGKEDLLK